MTSWSGVLKTPTLTIPKEPVFDRRADEALLASAHEYTSYFSGEQPYTPGTGFRIDLSASGAGTGAPAATGYSDFVRISDDFYVRIVDFSISGRTGICCPGEDWLK